MESAVTSSISPFFIVGDVSRTISFYGVLGFEVTFQEPSSNPFFAILVRHGAMLFVKAVGVPALPNPSRHADARWDAYISTTDPDALATVYSGLGIPFSSPLRDTHDGLRGFEIVDPDGYVLFFGRTQ